MDFRILGPLEVNDDAGRALEVGGRQQRLVLAMLLVHRNEVVSVDRLVDALWGEQPPTSAVKNVQIHVSRLRKALEAERRTRDQRAAVQVHTRANGYVLEVTSGELDADRFEQLVETGRRAHAAEELEQAEADLRDALSLWRGPPLADFAYDAFAQGEIARLEELRLAAVEEQIDVELALGRHSDVTARLYPLVADHPLRERLRASLMLALYRGGRKADALRVYDEARRMLAEELGLEPSESLRRLHSAVLADDPALAAPPRVPPTSDPPGLARSPLPLFTRRNRVLLGVGGALLLAAALAVALLTVTRDRTSAGIVSVGPNSLVAIDPETNRVVAEIPVGTRPESVTFARGHLWVANLDDDTVSRVDPKAGRVVRTIPTGTAPKALAEGHDAVWAIGGDGVILRIDPVFNKVVARIPTVKAGTLLKVAPVTGGVAATADAVWAIAGGYLSTPRLFRLDSGTGQAEPVIATGSSPTSIAEGLGDLWVTDNFENTVTRIDESGVVDATIPVGHGPIAIAVGEGAAWVVDSLDDAVVRIDPETNSPTSRIPVGRYPSAVAVGAGSVWVANRHDGTVSRIDPRTNEVRKIIDVGNSPAGVVFAAGSVWVTTQEGAPASESRTDVDPAVLRLSSSATFEIDPALNPDPQIAYATCAKLLNYPAASAPRGTRLVPEVAASLPTRSADGRTYTFTVRNGFAFSPPSRGERVTAETFRHALERSLHPKMDPGGTSVLSDIAGVDAYRSGEGGPHRRHRGRWESTLDHTGRAGPQLSGPDRDACLVRRSSQHAGRSEGRARDPVCRSVLRRRALAESPPRPQAEPQLPRVASPPLPRDPVLPRRRSGEECRGRARGTIGLRRRQSTRRGGCGAARPLRPGERRRAQRATAVLRQPDTHARVPRAEHEPAAVLGRPPAESGQLRDRPSGARTDRELGLRPVPVRPHRPVPAADDAGCEPNGPLSAERRPAYGTTPCAGRARHGRPLHLRRLPAALPATRTADQGEPGRARARRRHPGVPDRGARRARRNERGAVRPARHAMGSATTPIPRTS